jgi:hypothetical protein
MDAGDRATHGAVAESLSKDLISTSLNNPDPIPQNIMQLATKLTQSAKQSFHP